MGDRARKNAIRRPLLLTALIAAIFAVGTLCTLTMMRWAGNTPVIWIASSVLAAGLLMLPWRWGLVCSALCWALGTLAYSVHPLGWEAGALYQLVNLSEAWLLAGFCNHFIPNLRLTTLRRTVQLMVFAVVPATALGATATAVITVLMFGNQVEFSRILAQALAAKFLGMSVMLPALLILLGPRADHDPNRHPIERAAVYFGVVVLTVAPLVLWYYPAVLVLFPVLVAIAFRYGPRPTVLAAMIIGLGTIAISTWGWSLSPDKDYGKLWTGMLQQFVAAVFLTAIVTSTVISQQQRLRKQLVRRSMVARRARWRALQASKAKTDFLATMSHEIRTPMNSILGFAQLLQRRTDLPPEAAQQVVMVERSSAALLTIVDDILDFSKMEAGEVELSPRPTDLKVLAEDTMAIVADFGRSKGLSLRVSAESDAAGHFAVDDQRLRQVLLNLLNNAIKFTDQGEVCLTLSQRAGRVRFAVSDTGMGIPADRMDRLFKRFSQVDGSVTREYGGTGLGLAICKGLIEMMGGEISVDSTFGQGSTFWFELPLAACQAASEPRPADADEAGAIAGKVLLVDDHPTNRELGSAILAMLGCQVDLAEDGEQAVAALAREEYDAVLMDVHMPKMDGLSAARAIRALGGRAADTPIIAMSADVLPEQIERCRRAGMVDSVGKPIRIDALQAALEHWIGRDADGQARAA